MQSKKQENTVEPTRLPRPPFFEIGPKAYLFGDDVAELARAADAASIKYDVDILFTAPFVDLRLVVEETQRLFVCAPHMDALYPGRGLTKILPESLRAIGCAGVMLNHAEHPLTLAELSATVERAHEVGLFTIVCADSIREAKAVATLAPDIVVAEPTELIGTGRTSDRGYVEASNAAIRAVDSGILVLQGAGIRTAQDVYETIRSGADGTGSSSGITQAPDRVAAVDMMIGAVRAAWDDRTKEATT